MQLKTERLQIRPLTPADWSNLQKIAADFRKSAYAVYDMPLPIEEEKIKNLTVQFSESGLFFAVFLKETDEMIGYICFHKSGENYDLGFCFHSAFQGKGYAFESCSKIMEYLTEDQGIAKFTAGTALQNTPSCKLLKKLGFTLTGTETLAFHQDENGRDITFEGGIFTKITER